MGVAVLQALEQGQRRAELHVRGIAVSFLNDVLGDAVLQQRAGPVQITEDDGVFRSLGSHHLDDAGDFHLLRDNLFDLNFLFDFNLLGHNASNFDLLGDDLFDFLLDLDLFGHDARDLNLLRDHLGFGRRAGRNGDDRNDGHHHG